MLWTRKNHTYTAPPWSPVDLFRQGEQGPWYDPSDMSTLFQDSAGTTPVTAVEQFVGLVLDKSQGPMLGPELATSVWLNTYSTTFDTFTSTGGGGFTATVASAKSPRVRVPLALATGKTYKVTFDMVSTGLASASIWQSDAAYGGFVNTGITNIADGAKQAATVVVAGATNLMLIATFSGAGSITVSNVSVKELPGKHALQATTTKRPTYSRRVNLLTKTEQFSDADWTKSAATIDGTTHLAPDGTITATKIVFASGNANAIITQTIPATIGTVVRKIWIRADTPTTVRNRFRNNSGSVAAPVLSVTTEWQEIETTMTGTGTGIDTVGLQNNAAGDSAPIYIWRPRVTLSIDAHLPYQWVNTATDYDADPTKFPAYLRFDGVNRAMQTGNIDFTGTDKVMVCAGITKLSDAADGTLYMCGDPSAVQNGSFRADAPGSSTVAKYQVGVRGTAASIPYTSSSAYNAPNTTVFTQVSDIGADIAQMRLGGVLADSRTTDQGTGTYGNYPLYIGARGGTSLYFNGRLYSLIVRGTQTPLSQIEAAELYIKQKMRLP